MSSGFGSGSSWRSIVLQIILLAITVTFIMPRLLTVITYRLAVRIRLVLLLLMIAATVIVVPRVVVVRALICVRLLLPSLLLRFRCER